MSLDSVLITDSKRSQKGLEDMLTAAIGDHGYVLGYVEISVALLVIEAAKRSEDNPDWFPRGKWAMIQSMQANTERELRKMFKNTEA